MSSEFLQKVTRGATGEVQEALRRDPALAATIDERGVSALLLATYHGKGEIVDALLATGLELNIFEASATGQSNRVRELLQQDPGLVNAYSPDGFFPLGLAAFFRHHETLTILLDAGADIHQAAQNPMKVTALHAAAASGQVEVVKELLERGADPNSRQQAGYTALHQASHSGYLEMARLLVDHGADINQTTDDGKTALALASEHPHDTVAAFLRGKGGHDSSHRPLPNG